MTGPASIRVRRGLRSTLSCGSGRVLVPAFKTLGVRRQWDSRECGWLVPNRPAEDVLAYLEQRGGVLVQVESVTA